LLILCSYGHQTHPDPSSVTDARRFTDSGRFTDPGPFIGPGGLAAN
jgi:hypothetical protein